jgi:hypothetical protein
VTTITAPAGEYQLTTHPLVPATTHHQIRRHATTQTPQLAEAITTAIGLVTLTYQPAA